MTDPIKVNVEGATAVLRQFVVKIPAVTEDGLLEAFTEATEESRQRVARFSDALHDSIDGVVSRSGDVVEGLWGATADHAEPVEFGAKPHFVPERFIGDWAAAHGFGHTGLIVSGKAQPFIRRGGNERLEDVGERIGNRAVELIDKGLGEIDQ